MVVWWVVCHVIVMGWVLNGNMCWCRVCDMIDPNNDADFLMMELAQDAASIAAGVCPRCDEALDPSHPRWDDPKHWRPNYTRESAIRWAGSHSNEIEGFHDRCALEHSDSCDCLDCKRKWGEI